MLVNVAITNNISVLVCLSQHDELCPCGLVALLLMSLRVRDRDLPTKSSQNHSVAPETYSLYGPPHTTQRDYHLQFQENLPSPGTEPSQTSHQPSPPRPPRGHDHHQGHLTHPHHRHNHCLKLSGPHKGNTYKVIMGF